MSTLWMRATLKAALSALVGLVLVGGACAGGPALVYGRYDSGASAANGSFSVVTCFLEGRDGPVGDCKTIYEQARDPDGVLLTLGSLVVDEVGGRVLFRVTAQTMTNVILYSTLYSVLLSDGSELTGEPCG